MAFDFQIYASRRIPDFFCAAEGRRFKRFVLPAFAKFALLSGGGWLLDLATLITLTRIFDAPPFLANMASSVLPAPAARSAERD
jgi:hypothetical protein